MKGHGPLQITLPDGKVADFPRADDTFEVNNGLITVLAHVGGRGEDEYHVYKQWLKFSVAMENVD